MRSDEGAFGAGNGSGQSSGTGVIILIGDKVGVLMFKLVGRDNPNDGRVIKGALMDGKLIVGSETLRLENGVAKDRGGGVGMLKVDMLIVGCVRAGAVTDGAPMEGTFRDGDPNSSILLWTLDTGAGIEVEVIGGGIGTLFVGIAKIGRAVGVAGKLTMGRP